MTTSPPRRRFPPDQVGTAVGLFYGGMPISKISQNMANIYEIPPPSKATIHEWLTDYTRLALDTVKPLKAETGDEWVADEMVVKVGGKNFWNWNVMDASTRFILASYLSPNRTTREAETVMRRAMEASENLPKTIKTDRLKSYVDGIERVFGGDVQHIQSQGIRAEVNNNLSERLQGTFRQRTKVLRGFQSRETGQLFLDGWVLDYNYFRPHESLRGRTPADVAEIDAGFEEWEDFAKLDVRPFSRIRVKNELKRRQLRAKSPFRPPLKVRARL